MCTALAARIDDRMQQLIELLGVDAQHGLALRDDALGDHLVGDANRGGSRALAGARLQR